jgi:hypothetical protein
MQYVPRHRQDQKQMNYTNSQISGLIDEVIHSERDRAILKRRLIDGICFEPLAEEFDLSVVQVRRIVYRGQEKLIPYL